MQIDECLLRGEEKYNRGRLITGDNVPPSRQNYGGGKDGGRWVFGMVCATKGVLRLFEVDRRNAATLGAIIEANVQPGTFIHIDELAAYNCIRNLWDANRAMHQSALGDSQPQQELCGPHHGRSRANKQKIVKKMKRHLMKPRTLQRPFLAFVRSHGSFGLPSN